MSLKPGGKVGFICADRWMRNQYGRHLRALVAGHFSLDATIAMHDVDAFELTFRTSGRRYAPPSS